MSVLNLGLFRSNEVVEEIILPESLKIIEDQAFLGATALRKLEINGIETMGDYCIYGTRFSQMLNPKITTIRQNTREIGRIAADELISAIENPRATIVKRVVVDAELIEGETIRKIGN